ncbi:molybdopterin-guanine dinucleotide biosynthesis protein B [Alkalicoccus daliensis]|uniref:Molybdopterin-guanine dinucleotide biosynthesis protein B n=1 Tax=Alkalicoccus daliensis TaxID=745820 RepID=A0A1G9ZAQ3_9BACI|nr:molybdopterin-guanine dinucleotide biosynthesis protein B [Alkalicoccus daliensis]SDN18558.1 molybdopterin-guanine dinucleotide biosynthesis protein B [Alkalicoccus daliensis]
MRVFQVVGWSNSGKTTLTAELITFFSAQGVKVSTIKHHGKAEVLHLDRGETDTAKHRKAGAVSSMLTSKGEQQWNIEQPLSLEMMIQMHLLLGTELLLIEGYKQEMYPKIAVSDSGAAPASITNVKAVWNKETDELHHSIEELGRIVWEKSEIIL